MAGRALFTPLVALAQDSSPSSCNFERAKPTIAPIHYQKHIRLQEARIRFMSSKDYVTAIGSPVGYVACLLASDTAKWKPATALSTTRRKH
jgi:hypothetical protein